MRFPVSFLMFVVAIVAVASGWFRFLDRPNYEVVLGSRPVGTVGDGKTVEIHELVNYATGEWGRMELRAYQRWIFLQATILFASSLLLLCYGCWRWPRKALSRAQFFKRVCFTATIVLVIVGLMLPAMQSARE